MDKIKDSPYKYSAEERQKLKKNLMIPAAEYLDEDVKKILKGGRLNLNISEEIDNDNDSLNLFKEQPIQKKPEVYRTTPDLEKAGLLAKKYNTDAVFFSTLFFVFKNTNIGIYGRNRTYIKAYNWELKYAAFLIDQNQQYIFNGPPEWQSFSIDSLNTASEVSDRKGRVEKQTVVYSSALKNSLNNTLYYYLADFCTNRNCKTFGPLKF